jgi:hypothetical protein
MTDQPHTHGEYELIHAVTVLADLYDQRWPEWQRAAVLIGDVVRGKCAIANVAGELITLSGLVQQGPPPADTDC